MVQAMNSRPKILVTRKLPQPVEDRLSTTFDAILSSNDRQMTSNDILAMASGLDGLLVCATDRCDAALINALPASIRIIATYSVGYDHIDLAAARNAKITVTNTPDVLTDATADIALLLLLGAARGAYWGERMVRKGTWGAWAPTHPLGLDITGRRLAILGMGRIGQAVARRARAFDMKIHYHNRSRLTPDLEQGAIYHDSLESLLAVSDYLSINCASTPQTRGIINAAAISKMPDGAVIINTARGDIIDDSALIAALVSGKLAAAGLDVFNNEPELDSRYKSLDNVFLLPHLGSATPGTRVAMGMRATDNLEAFFKGRKPADALF